MRVITPETEAAWLSPVKDGPTRPVVRATIEIVKMAHPAYDTNSGAGSQYKITDRHNGTFGNILFGTQGVIQELPNIRKYTWNRGTSQDIAECQITLLNTDLSPIGDVEDAPADDWENPGQLTYNRGKQTMSTNRWGYSADTGWIDVIGPDRLVRTYEGYGADWDVMPGNDPNLYISGTWLIDDVTYNNAGDIVLNMRDLARLLVDSIAFPPNVPWSDYPLQWSKWHTVTGGTHRWWAGGKLQRPKSVTSSSNEEYIGHGIVDTPTYVGAHGAVQGHYPSHAITGGGGTYWMSTGQRSADSFVWWQQTFATPQNIEGIRISPWGGPYKMWISLQRSDGHWVGARKIPYKTTTAGIDNGAKITFARRVSRSEHWVDGTHDIVLAFKHKDIKRVRITFSGLQNDGTTKKYPYRAGIRDIQVYVGKYSSLHFVNTPNDPATEGNYGDYTDIVKWCCAWAGFHWPATKSSVNWMSFDGIPANRVHYAAARDARMVSDRVWGSFQQTGTAGIADLTADNFDKQPLMDCISYVRDIVGFSFWVDESGGVVWRMPNLFEAGNYVTPDHKHNRNAPTRTSTVLTLDENETLLSYSTTLSSKNLRERIFVGDVAGKYGTVIKGYTPYDVGFQRIAGWMDQNFRSNTETKVAADMAAAQQMFDFRRGKATIPGNPAIQIDDQIRIYERVTNETFYHYVQGITCSLNNETGEWTYDLDTHWLGEDPNDAWAVTPAVLTAETQSYLSHLGTVD